MRMDQIAFKANLRTLKHHGSQKTDLTVKNGIFCENLAVKAGLITNRKTATYEWMNSQLVCEHMPQKAAYLDNRRRC